MEVTVAYGARGIGVWDALWLHNGVCSGGQDNGAALSFGAVCGVVICGCRLCASWSWVRCFPDAGGAETVSGIALWVCGKVWCSWDLTWLVVTEPAREHEDRLRLCIVVQFAWVREVVLGFFLGRRSVFTVVWIMVLVAASL